MKVLFFNDTRIETNPGCHATVTELSKFVTKHLPSSQIEFKPLGTEYGIFKHGLYKQSNKLLLKVLRKFKVLKNRKVIDLKLWEQCALQNISEETKNSIKRADLVLINMEGTIHHNSMGGLTLLAIGYYSKHIGKVVALVNGSYQEMHDEITKKVMGVVDFISVRETSSYNYLKSKNIDVSIIPDFAFRANINQNDDFNKNILLEQGNPPEKKCLYTVGVLGVYPNQKDGISLLSIKKQINDIKALGFQPYYLKIEEKEIQIASELNKIGVQTISYEDGVDYQNIGNLINHFDVLITGRYHIGIFGLMNYVPTFFLKSNTYKIEGLLAMLGLKELAIVDNDIRKIKLDRINENYQLPNDKSFLEFRNFLENLSNKN
ncbi:polysaccharide pyruvyl transferase family protein [Flavobacteriaceae bacterium SZ-1-7]|uniref:polysaccharide pyruvyl transferase family protein n=1 Tax=Tamlana sedimenti TaxID=3134126 RepID=UPI003123F5D9